jgi:hypothetical protein
VLVVPALPATATISLYKVVVRDGVPALRAFGQIRVPAAALP